MLDTLTRTSENDPIEIHFVSADAHGLPGRLGITYAPGKCGQGPYASWDRDLEKDLARLRHEYDAKVLVSLIEKFEMHRVSIPTLLESVKRAGMKSIWFPIPDVSTPHTVDAPIPVVNEIIEHLRDGDTVVVHCMGGFGRAGTITACVLAARGVDPDRAVEIVRAARPGALETRSQVDFVGLFAKAWRDASRT
ncbi:MAG TPA: cyclin-dependent kinase inhibitor 3 family protein [Anaeromyxobacteraceae bacterium]|nr:cyclin-dependent kinase inhibitor 3 family protein [Anaeromyxobacteraceae bacterium]